MKIYDYMELLRRIVFYFFIILYLVICPLVILYAFGYIYNPLRKDIEETGLVHIKTRPANASVYLEKSRYKYVTPTTIYNLFPGIYKISLFLKSHHPWSDNIPIEPGKAVDLDRVLLLPQLFKKREIVKRPVFDILPIGGTNNLLVLEKQRFNQIKVLSLDDYQLEDLVKNISVEHIYTADNSNRILVRTKKAGKAGYLVIDVTDSSKTKDITNLVKSLPEYVSWTDQIPDYIFTFQKDYVNMIDVTKEGIYPEYLKRIKGFGLFGSSIYILNEDYTTAKLVYDKPETKETLEDEALEEKIFSKSKSGYFRLDVLTNEIIAFLGNKKDLILNLPPYLIPDEKIIGINFFPDDSKLLMWTKQKAGIADIAAQEENTGEEIFKYIWIYKSGMDIKQCFFVYSGSHVLFLDGDKVYMLSLRQYGKHAAHEIVAVKRDSHIFYSESKGELYFIDPNTGYLCAITILPK